MKKSNQFSNKITARKDLINSFTVISALLIIVYGILMYLFTLAPEQTNGVISSLIEQDLLSSMPRYEFCYETGSAIFLTIVAGLALGISQFEFLHRKKYCSTLCSFSVSRRRLYLNRLVLPFILMTLCITIPHIVTLKINIDAFGFSSNMLLWFLMHILTFIQTLTVTYAISVAACMFTGRTIEAVAGAISIAALPSAISYIIENVFDRLLFGYFNKEAFLNFDPTYLCTILFHPQISGHYQLNTALNSESIMHLIFSVVWTILGIASMLALAPHFSKKFKPENSGFKGINKTMVFIISFTIPFFLTGFFAELLDSYFFYPSISLNSNLYIVVLATLIGFVLSLICGTVIHFTHKKLKISLISAITLVCSIAVLMVLSVTGIFGTYNKIPDASEIEKIEIEAPFSDFFPDYDIYTNFSKQYVYDSTTALVITKKEDIELVREIHQKASKRENNATSSKLYITYSLKDGSKINRDYAYLSEDATRYIIRLWDTKAAKEIYQRFFFPESESVEVLDSDPDYSFDYHQQPHIMDYNDEYASLIITAKDGTSHSVLNKISENDFTKLKKALYKDICESGSSEWFTPKKPQIGKISFDLANYQQYPEAAARVDFYVNENMKNTINVLKEIELYKYFKNTKAIKGVLMADIKKYISWENGRFFDKKVKAIHQPYFVSDYADDSFCWSLYLNPYEDYEEPPVKEITDKMQIKSLTEKGYTAYNIINDGRIIFVKYTNGTYSSYVIPYEK